MPTGVAYISKLDILTLYAFFFLNATVPKFKHEIFNILLYFDFLQMFHELTMKSKV